MSTQTHVDAGAMMTSRDGHIALKLPIEVKCSWQVRRREGRSSLQALTSDNFNERAGVYLPFAQLLGYSVSSICCLSIWLVDHAKSFSLGRSSEAVRGSELKARW